MDQNPPSEMIFISSYRNKLQFVCWEPPELHTWITADGCNLMFQTRGAKHRLGASEGKNPSFHDLTARKTTKVCHDFGWGLVKMWLPACWNVCVTCVTAAQHGRETTGKSAPTSGPYVSESVDQNSVTERDQKSLNWSELTELHLTGDARPLLPAADGVKASDWSSPARHDDGVLTVHVCLHSVAHDEGHKLWRRYDEYQSGSQDFLMGNQSCCILLLSSNPPE